MKIYNQFTDKQGNEYKFSNYLSFAEWWFSLPYATQVKKFPNDRNFKYNRKKLQFAAANSKEAKTRQY